MKTVLALTLPLLAWPAFAQAPATGTETRAAVEQRTIALFKQLDEDGDGIVTRDEMARFAAARSGTTAVPGAPLSPGAAAMFDDADGDHDGRITRAEAVAAALRGFDEADTDHDGKVSPQERAAAVRRFTAQIAPAEGDAPAAAREVAGPPAPPQ